MVENIKAGNKYRVIDDDENFFSNGDIVVALENDANPFCILEECFTNIEDCLNNDEIFDNCVRSLYNNELEEIKDCKNEIENFMEIEIRYMANDGEIFDTEKECLEHCTKIKNIFENKIKNILEKINNNKLEEIAFFDDEANIFLLDNYNIDTISNYIEKCSYMYVGNVNNEILQCLNDKYLIPDSIGLFKWNYEHAKWNKIIL